MAAATTLFSVSTAQLLRSKPSASSQTLAAPLSISTRTTSRRSSIRNKSRLVLKASATVDAVETSRVSTEEKKSDGTFIVIDNYDSFTYNLCQYMGEAGCNFEVYRNDELTVEELVRLNPRGILISPGPGSPQDSGISLQTVLELGHVVPIFGVCMGLQCIGEAFGGKIVRSPFGVVHGKSSPVYYDEKGEDGLLSGLPNPFTAGRYHSLVIEKESFPSEELEVTAWTDDGLIMAVRHKKYKHIQAVQFHPESILTTEGKMIVQNFVKLVEQTQLTRGKLSWKKGEHVEAKKHNL